MNLPNGLTATLHKMRQGRSETLSNGDILTWYMRSGKIVVLHEYVGNQGWDIYLSSNEDNQVQSAIDAIEKHIAEPVA